MLQRRALSALLTYPATGVVVVLTATALWLFFDWFSPSLPMAAAAVALALALLLAWPVILLRDPGFMAALARAPGEVDAAASQRVRNLELQLGQLGADQALEQLRLLRQKLENLVAVLRHRLDEGEVTYGRYLATAEQVYLAALDNLHEVVVALTGLAGMDQDYIDRRVHEIERDGVTDKERTELESLLQRRALLRQQREKIDDLLAGNERAMTVLDNTSAALADTRMRAGHAAVSADEAIRDLEALASRAGRYASGK